LGIGFSAIIKRILKKLTKASWTPRLEKLFDKLSIFDYLTVTFVILNILDLLSTIIGIFSGKGEEITILMIQILESYGIIGFTFLKLGFSVLLLFFLSLKYWKSNIWTKSVTTALWICSLILVPIYVFVIVENISIIL
jgi:hypothetical protein